MLTDLEMRHPVFPTLFRTGNNFVAIVLFSGVTFLPDRPAASCFFSPW